MVWKESIATTDVGDAARYGAADLLKLMRWINGTGGIDTVTVNDPLMAFSTFIKFWNPAGTFTYSVITTAIAANRNITLPLLAGNDTFVFESHTQTLDNKTLTNSTITSPTTSNPSISGTITLADATNIAVNTTIGTKIGTATTQKIGFYNATPIVQPAANADTSGAILADVETEVNQIKQLLRDLGLMA